MTLSIIRLQIAVLLLILVACNSSKKQTGNNANAHLGVWTNTEKIQGKSYHKIFFVVMTADIEARAKLEDALATTATARGYEAVKSVDRIKFDFSNPKAPSKEEVVKEVKATGCEAVLVAALLSKEEAVKYTPATTAYAAMPNYVYIGSYYGFYSNMQATVSTPSYYTREKEYFMQSNLYDVATEEIMWAVQSKIFNPTNLDNFSKSYVATLIKQLEKSKIMRK